MSEEPDTGSLFASPQSMGASGSLPIPEVGAEEDELQGTEVVGDDLPEEDLDGFGDDFDLDEEE